MQKIKLAKQSEHVYVKELKNRSEANWFILKLYISEAKRTGSIVILYLKSHKKALFFNERQKQKCSIMNYRSFGIPSRDVDISNTCRRAHFRSRPEWIKQKALQLFERKEVRLWYRRGDNTGPSRRACSHEGPAVSCSSRRALALREGRSFRGWPCYWPAMRSLHPDRRWWEDFLCYE